MHGWEGRQWGPRGPGGPAGPFGEWGGRRRMRRGAVRRAVLWALSDGPGHGYEVMRRLEERTAGMWRPSPGSVYPTLQMLEDEGLVRSRTDDGTRTYELTDEGRAAMAGPGWGGAPGGFGGFGGFGGPGEPEGGADPAQLRALREAVHDARAAVRQIAQTGRPHQLEKAVEIVQQARRSLYQLLAEG